MQLYVVISEGLDIGAYRAAARVTGFTGLPGLEHIFLEFAAGRNETGFVTPVIAINYVH